MARAVVTKTVRLPSDLAEEFEAIARVLGQSENAVATNALTSYIRKSGLREQIHAEVAAEHERNRG